MTISSSEIKRNMTIMIDNEIFQILEWQHRKPPKAPPTLTLRVKNIKTGNVFEKKLQGNRPLTLARTDKRPFQYLYSDSTSHTFMNNETFEQINIDPSILGNALDFIIEGDIIEVISFEENPISIELPISVILEVIDSEQAVRGDTATNVTKTATVNTGLKVQVPLFIETGGKIKIDTRTGQYIERSN
ncbi:MAG: elongation factor P [Dehalococcoidia bacterium]|nr:elongation factor P [Dehalococcoidia bacterium]|tara:strand:- start:434 stop:997 length:564 start_codon:yes stop_codon:yes gene_type:complete